MQPDDTSPSPKGVPKNGFAQQEKYRTVCWVNAFATGNPYRG